MDVGRYKFDHQYLLNADRSRPDIILRDGSLIEEHLILQNYKQWYKEHLDNTIYRRLIDQVVEMSI